MGISPYANTPSQPFDPDDHLQIRALLPEYLACVVLGQILAPAWRPLEEHLRRCPACRNEADALRRLLDATYTGTLSLAADAPPPRLAFLPARFDLERFAIPPERPPPPDHTPPGSIVLPFSAALLTQMHVRMTARSGNIRKRYEHIIVPRRPQDPTVKVEIFELVDNAEQGQVRICVERPDHNPFDQAGASVRLLVGDLTFDGQTNQSGVVVFSSVPLAAIDSWELQIIPPESE